MGKLGTVEGPLYAKPTLVPQLGHALQETTACLPLRCPVEPSPGCSSLPRTELGMFACLHARSACSLVFFLLKIISKTTFTLARWLAGPSPYSKGTGDMVNI